MALSISTESGLTDGAAGDAGHGDRSIGEGPRAREFAIADDSAAGIISAERRAPSAERRAPSAERLTMAGAHGAVRRPETSGTSARPARAGLPNPFRFLFAALRPRIGFRGGLAAALVLLALAALAPAGPAQAQSVTGLTVWPRVGGLSVYWDPYPGAVLYTVRVWSGQVVVDRRDVYRVTPSHFTGLTPGTAYRVSVDAFDDDGLIPDSTVDTTATPVAQRVRLDPLHEGNALLVRWLRVPGASFYIADVFLGGSQSSPDSSGIINATSSAASHTYTFTGLNAGTNYRVRVKAYDANANELQGLTGEATKRPLLPPVTGLSVSAASATSLQVNWNAVSGANRYYLEYRGGSAGTWTQAFGTGAVTTRTITGLTAGAHYSVRVQAGNVGAGGLSIWTIGDGVPEALVPTGLTATDLATSGDLLLQWEWEVETSISLNLKRWIIQFESASGDHIGDRIETDSVKSTIISGLRPETTYTFRVHAELTDGTRSGHSNPVIVTMPAASGAPARPTLLKAVSTAWDHILLTWRQGEGNGVTGYEVQFSVSGGAWTTAPGSTGSLHTRYVHNDDGGLTPGAWHRYRVRAVNARSSSAWSGVLQHRIPGRPVGFEYSVSEYYGPSGLTVPSGSSSLVVLLPEVYDGHDPIQGVTYTLTVQGGGALPEQLRYDPATRTLRSGVRNAEGARIGGIGGHLPLTLVWTAVAPAPCTVSV